MTTMSLPAAPAPHAPSSYPATVGPATVPTTARSSGDESGDVADDAAEADFGDLLASIAVLASTLVVRSAPDAGAAATAQPETPLVGTVGAAVGARTGPTGTVAAAGGGLARIAIAPADGTGTPVDTSRLVEGEGEGEGTVSPTPVTAPSGTAGPHSHSAARVVVGFDALGSAGRTGTAHTETVTPGGPAPVEHGEITDDGATDQTIIASSDGATADADGGTNGSDEGARGDGAPPSREPSRAADVAAPNPRESLQSVDRVTTGTGGGMDGGTLSDPLAPTRTVRGAGLDPAVRLAAPNSISLDLGDEGLGALTVTASADRGAVNLLVTAGEERTRDALLQQRADLLDDLESAGITLGTLDIHGGDAGADEPDEDPGAHGRSRDLLVETSDPEPVRPTPRRSDDAHLDLRL